MKRIFLETGNVIHPRSPRLGQPALDSDLGPEVSDGCPHNVAKPMGPPVSSCNTVRQDPLQHGWFFGLAQQTTLPFDARQRWPWSYPDSLEFRPNVAGPCASP